MVTVVVQKKVLRSGLELFWVNQQIAFIDHFLHLRHYVFDLVFLLGLDVGFSEEESLVGRVRGGVLGRDRNVYLGESAGGVVLSPVPEDLLLMSDFGCEGLNIVAFLWSLHLVDGTSWRVLSIGIVLRPTQRVVRAVLFFLELSIVVADHHLRTGFGKSRVKSAQSRPLRHAVASAFGCRQPPVLTAISRVDDLLRQTLVEHVLVHVFDGSLTLAEHAVQLLLSQSLFARLLEPD